MQTTAMFSLVKVLKNAPKMTMGMLVMSLVIILTSCTQESLEIDPSAASNLIYSNDLTSKLGYTNAWWEGSAINAQAKTLSCRAEQNYVGEDTITVGVLGLPVVQVGEPKVNPDGSIDFTFSDGEIVTLTEEIVANGVDFTNKTTFTYATLDRIDDKHEQVTLHFNNNWKLSTDQLPSNVTKEAKGNEDVPFMYIHELTVVPVDPITYRKSLVLDFEDASNGEAYGDMLVEKVQGSTILDSWDCFGIMAKWGKYNPQVSSQSVTSFDFTSHDVPGEKKDLESDLPGLGKGKTFTRKNVRHTAETFEVKFTSNPDANGETIRPIRGQIDVWVYEYVFVNPEDNHKETFTVEVEVKSVKSEVNNSTYEREIHVVINGQVVDVQNGKVTLVIS